MRKRTEDWRDLLSAYSLALDAKKVWMGLVATVASVAIIGLTAVVYEWITPGVLGGLGSPTSDKSMLWQLMEGKGLNVLAGVLPLLNPFHAGLVHFILSSLMYVLLFYVWTGSAGVVSRLAALEYARDDLPTLAEAREMVRSKRKAYFMAPMMPFLFILFLCALNFIGGLIASLWIPGRILLIFPGFPLLVASTVVIVFLLVLGVLSFGMMMPAVSVGGKDGFESWSTAYSYVLWGLRRFIGYAFVAGVIGLVAAFVACRLTDLLIYLIIKTVNFGYLNSVRWIAYDVTRAGVAVMPAGQGATALPSNILVLLFLGLRALPVAYVFSYFFTANTIIFLLMRKDQDNVDVDEIYQEIEEEEDLEPIEEAPTVDMPKAPEEPTEPAEPQASKPEDETAGEEEDRSASDEGDDSDKETS
jgi:hypothetical protein